MNHAISIELKFFLISVLWGCILLLIYDCLRILRRLIKHDSFFIALEDLIFWVAASLYIFAMIYKQNNGIIRGFSVMGMAIGMVLYHYIASDLLVNMITKLLRTLISPFSYAIKKVRQAVKFIINKFGKAANFINRRLKKYQKSVKITLNKKRQAATDRKRIQAEKKALKKRKKKSKDSGGEKVKAGRKQKADKRLKGIKEIKSGK
jgi:spore cortex biosynthesis protein YabQ